ncbi:MAG: M16 family metallopeptidase [Saprospiraceae bacterium]
MMNVPGGKFTYQTVPSDPFDVKMYTLPNGLRLYLSVNKNEPRIYTNIVVRSGSKQDPADTTGLAHYMEHMLFKGTSQIGALDWEKEKVYLEQISNLYEQHRQTQDEAERQKIYAEIDRLSFEAAKLVAPNEYDKLSSTIGAKDTNAYTWLEQTVYVNDIPANELERWMKLESERFRMMALRLFHTELETVYEEFNIGQDKDFRKVSNAIRQVLFPSHPYGTQTTIGSAQHLKNPSHVKIQEYFQTYYVPNNMAIVMAGDFDLDEAVQLAEQYFGDYQAKPFPPFKYEEQAPLTAPVRREVFGQEAAYVELAWRLEGSQSYDHLMLLLLQGILYNEQAGLFDIYLNQEQKVLEAEAWEWLHEDYSVLGLYGKPREGQSLEEVEQLLLSMIERLKTGDFEDWLIEAVIKNYKLEELREVESNRSRVNALTQAFVLGVDWQTFVNYIKSLERITKQDIIEFSKSKFADNYVVVYKRQGNDPNVIKVEKPPITAVELNRDGVSEFAAAFFSEQVPPLKPVFVDFEEVIQHRTLQSGLQLDYVRNPQNALFRLDYIFEMGKNNERRLALALQYLPYLGTDRYTPARLQQEFYRLGLSFDVYNSDDRAYVTLSGLEESLEEGIQLFEHILANVQEDAGALANMVSDILMKRQNAKKDRDTILRDALSSFARYGSDSPFTYRLSESELRNLKPSDLTEWIRSLTSYEHRIYYYGQKSIGEIAGLLEKYHQVPARLQPTPGIKHFAHLATERNCVFFLDFPIVQTDIMLVSRGTPHFNLEEHRLRRLYNEYFGYGLSSIVFQEIRESKALAYSTYAMHTSPRRQHFPHYLQAYVGTQPDKISDAVPAMLNIIDNMPLVDLQIETARLTILRQMESERMAPRNIYWEAVATQDLGLNRNIAPEVYQAIQEANVATLANFHQAYIKGRAFNIVVLGDRKRVNLDYLANFGEVQELGIDQVFGF